MLRLLTVLALALLAAACSSTEPEDSTVDPFSRSLLSLASIDGFGGIALDGDAVTLYTLGEHPEAAAAAQRLLGAGVALTVSARPVQGRGSESLEKPNLRRGVAVSVGGLR